MFLYSYDSLFDVCQKEIDADKKAVENTFSFKRKYDFFLESSQRQEISGDRIVKDFEIALDSFVGYERSDAQKQFHTEFINATIQHFYTPDEWSANREKILKEQGLVNQYTEVLVCCPRRFGKSVAVSMFIACMLQFVPDAWISCFSTGQRASTSLLDMAAKFLASFPGYKERIYKKNTEQLFYKGKDAGDLRRFHSFPSSVAGLKGQGGKIIILEEASRLNEEVFSEVVLPLLGVSGTSLIAISTPLESENFFSQLLLAKKPNGADLFKVMTIELICKACRAEKKTECPHSTQLPPWKSEARGELVKQLMSSNQDMWLREQAGVVTNKDLSAFDVTTLEHAFKPENAVSIRALVPENYLYLAIDPSGGGFSETAIAGAFVDTNTGKFVISSADSRAIESDGQLESFISGHLRLIRAEPTFSNIEIVVIIERNYGGSVQSSRIANICCAYPPIHIITGDGSEKKLRSVGVITTNLVKERARIDIQRLLRNEKFKISKTLISQNSGALDMMFKQMKSFRFVQKVKADRVITTLTGKGFNSRDDLAMAIMLLTFWAAFVAAEGPRCYVF